MCRPARKRKAIGRPYKSQAYRAPIMENQVDLTPLDRVRQAETEAAGRVAAARLKAERLLRQAQDRLPDLRAEAETAARQAGEAQAAELASEAEHMASAERERAKARAAELERLGGERMAPAVEAALRVILGADDDR